ncbi:hypothetical protein HYH03_005881 [Edaphochlamys debaryana]|uniref:Nuclear nucleic acid-binding protein C1D n=1 Tax=Edaphochlamys debaryana TaxID=47281 RepID=A0A835Y845_9CHLO|nr:hypothetical protein HYH03_005881 [Edaphochlamys debaryana]|eukprot:KAG2495951.1 hypothetical protein HYH03_005881 [Edaphochlamys debaryana]
MAAPLELPDDVKIQLSQLTEFLGDLKKALGAAAALGGPAEVLAKTAADPVGRARLYQAVAKAVNALHHTYLRAHGRDPFAPVGAGAIGGASVGKAELDRIRQYDKKVNRAFAEAELRSARRLATLDVAGASRFISAAVPDLTPEQRAAMKRAAAAVEARRGSGAAPGRGAKRGLGGPGAGAGQEGRQGRGQGAKRGRAAAEPQAEDPEGPGGEEDESADSSEAEEEEASGGEVEAERRREEAEEEAVAAAEEAAERAAAGGEGVDEAAAGFLEAFAARHGGSG